MALKKKLVTNNIEATYWRIVGFNLSITGEMCQIFLIGYTDNIARQSNKNIVSKNYMIKKDKFNQYIKLENGIIIADLYKFLKHETNDFNDSEDI